MFFLGHRASSITQELICKMLNQSFQEIQKRSIQENVYIITGGVTTITNGIISAFISLISDLSLSSSESLPVGKTEPRRAEAEAALRNIEEKYGIKISSTNLLLKIRQYKMGLLQF